ncbi:hypothetical protein M378DRAFT_10301 [Amanita muscaria Koide BX008]|uniref:Uncharacterized protein n=1 Tax=Amanita muscaria (strain Koide BX008) TaxID=946122 RepID=A0A0C2XAZ4_AMAMK|nr:hypothetical protein M378DRAFT_10301 [Amanita muscaria Koide BX008]
MPSAGGGLGPLFRTFVHVGRTSYEGTFELRDQLREYQFRGNGLEEYSLWDFVVNTYDHIRNNETKEEHQGPKRGRPSNLHINYQDSANKPSHCCIVRSPHHEHLVRFVGRWFPRSDDPAVRELYCAEILMVFKPWRNLTDLTNGMATFDTSFHKFLATASSAVKKKIQNIQYYHECSDNARARRRTWLKDQAVGPLNDEQDEDIDMEGDAEVDGNAKHDCHEFWIPKDEEITEEDLERARLKQVYSAERQFATRAMEAAQAANVFHTPEMNVLKAPVLPKASIPEAQALRKMDTLLKAKIQEQLENSGTISMTTQSKAELSPTNVRPNITLDSQHAVNSGGQTDQPVARPLLKLLNEEQLRAHNIVERALLDHKKGK